MNGDFRYAVVGRRAISLSEKAEDRHGNTTWTLRTLPLGGVVLRSDVCERRCTMKFAPYLVGPGGASELCISQA